MRPAVSVIFGRYVLINDTRAVINYKLEPWRELLESRGFKLGKIKTEYMKCKFVVEGKEVINCEPL